MKRMTRILMTGAAGQIGSELIVELRKRFGSANVIATDKRTPSDEFLKSGPFETLDTSDASAIASVTERHGVDTVYHLAAILSAAGEHNPQLAWEVNIRGLYNVLELARQHKGTRVFWPSSIAAFGPKAARVNTPQNSIMIPNTMYGVAKVAGELLCNYYHTKFGIDVRSVRYPGIIGSEALPGSGTTDYAVAIFYEAIKKKRYTCFLREETVLPMMYMPDCINATVELMEANESRVKCRTSYNLMAMSFSPGELADEIKKHIPEFICEYVPDFRQQIADSWPVSVDDSEARRDWGWKPTYDLSAMTKDMIEKLTRKYEAGRLS